MKRYQGRGTRRVWVLALVVGVLAVSLGCTISGFTLDTVEVGELERHTEVVEAGDVEEVRVYIKMGGGELNIDNGADELLEAEFAYNVSAWEPEVEYEMTNGTGRLTIRQPNTDQVVTRGNMRNEWDLRFADDVALDMRLEVGAGGHEIDLAGLRVTQLDMKLGAGDVSIDVSDNPQLTDVEFDIGAGDATINLAGVWEHDVEVDVQGGVGKTTLLLPEDIGVRVNVSSGLGSVKTSGLEREGDVYVNDAYGESQVVMEVSVQSGIGEVNLEVGR